MPADMMPLPTAAPAEAPAVTPIITVPGCMNMAAPPSIAPPAKVPTVAAVPFAKFFAALF